MAYTTIDDPSAYFQAKIWTGDGATSTRTITNGANSPLAPDLIWGACRSNVQHKWIQDSSRGFSTGNKELVTNNTQVEGDTNAVNSGAYGWLGPSVTDGFKTSKGSVNSGYWNVNARTYVAWQWKANGGTTVTNNDGSITTTTQVNSDAGFSIVTWSGGGTGSLGHGLGVVPDMWIVKNRDYAVSWAIGFSDSSFLGGTSNYLSLNTDGATATYNNLWGSSPANSSTITMAGDRSVNISGDDYVAYFFKAKQGYSKFGKYVGNGGTGGKNNFIYTGFKPAFVMVKRTDSTSNWAIPTNYNNVATNAYIWANNNNTQGNGAIFITATGFKITSTAGGYGAAGGTYIYIAFAEYPIVTSTGVPTTAR